MLLYNHFVFAMKLKSFIYHYNLLNFLFFSLIKLRSFLLKLFLFSKFNPLQIVETITYLNQFMFKKKKIVML